MVFLNILQGVLIASVGKGVIYFKLTACKPQLKGPVHTYMYTVQYDFCNIHLHS